MATFEFSGKISGTQNDSLFETLGAKIKVIGVGGAGGNAINSMISENIHGVEFIAVNSDFQDLQKSKSKRVIQIGKNIAKGLGVGGDPSLGNECAKADQNDITEALQGSDMVFITAGWWNWYWSCSSCQTCKRYRALTIAIVTKPLNLNKE